MAVAVLEERAIQGHEMSVSEVDRYLGLPGSSYFLQGRRTVWLRSGEQARERLGERFSLKRFHAFALALGPMGLDPGSSAPGRIRTCAHGLGNHCSIP